MKPALAICMAASTTRSFPQKPSSSIAASPIAYPTSPHLRLPIPYFHSHLFTYSLDASDYASATVSYLPPPVCTYTGLPVAKASHTADAYTGIHVALVSASAIAVAFVAVCLLLT
jgi:hypothetical protein